MVAGTREHVPSTARALKMGPIDLARRLVVQPRPVHLWRPGKPGSLLTSCPTFDMIVISSDVIELICLDVRAGTIVELALIGSSQPLKL